MSERIKKRLKIMIVDDEQDILTLYSDYLSSKGHQVINKYLTPNNIIADIEKQCPDMYLIDYRLPGNKNGIDVAIEILNKLPSAHILFITAFEPVRNEISKNPSFHKKNIGVLLKPVKLDEIEQKIIDMSNKDKTISSLVM